MRFQRALTIILALGVSGETAAASARGASPATVAVHTKVAKGLVTIIFSAKEGEIVLRLTDDIRAHDLVSGTVGVLPSGETDAERRSNSITLGGEVLEMFGQSKTVNHGIVSWITPNFLVGLTTPLMLRGSGSRPIASTNVPIQALPGSPVDPVFLTLTEIIIPPKGKAGEPLQIFGGFDGDLNNTFVTMGGRHLEALAESPRKCVVLTPADMAGRARLLVVERGSETSGDYENKTSSNGSILKVAVAGAVVVAITAVLFGR